MAKVYQPPGVYLEEQSAFLNRVVPVATAVPAFVGYTEKAVRGQVNLTNVPSRGVYHHHFSTANAKILSW